MFNFMKKDKEHKKEKDERKREKKEKKEREKKEKHREPITHEELKRLEEVKKGVFRRKSDREKKRQTTSPDDEEGGFAQRESYQSLSSDSSASVTSGGRPSPGSEYPQSGDHKLTPPRVLPKPAVRGILKSKGSGHSVSDDVDDQTVLRANTYRNMEMSGQPVQTQNGTKPVPIQRTTKGALKERPPEFQAPPPPETPPPEKAYRASLKLPDIIPSKPPRVRELVINRTKAGDFGFTLRKATTTATTARKGDGNGDGPEMKQTVIFAEPGAGQKSSQTGLIPGDRLVEVNGVNVEHTPREEIVDMIKKTGDTVTLKVQPIPELIELSVRPAVDGALIDVQEDVVKGGTLRRSGSLRYKKPARSETEVQSEKAWMDAERVWLVHKGGFASASQLKGDGLGLPEGRVKIRLDHGGEILEVDEDDVEKANPPQLDRAEDLALLRYLNESSVLHTLRQRYGGNLIHTYAGPSLVIVNPMQPLQIYSEKVIQMFKGCKQEDMPPHIFASAQIAYREMLNTRQDQSIVFMGRSGSGKTYNMRHILHYLTASTASVNNILSVEKLNAMTILIEAFGNSRTILNTTASRYSQLTTIDYDHSGQIVSASIQVLLFEKTRVVRRPEGEPTFHVFYQLLAGVDSKLRSELQLNSLTDPNLFMTPLQKAEDKQRAVQYWSKIYNAMEVVQMSEDEIKSICSVLSAIYHLGVAGAVKGNNNKGQFARPAAAQRAATMLGISVEELGRNIFSSSGTATLGRSATARGASPADKYGDAHTTAMEALEGFLIGLYSDCFNAVVSLINRSLSSTYRSATSIQVVDTPGFQNPGTCGRQTGGSFEDLCYNYTQEKLQLLFHDLVFTMPQDRYSQENVECDFEFVTTSPAAMVSLIDKPSQQSLLPRPASYHEHRDKSEKLYHHHYQDASEGHRSVEGRSKVRGHRVHSGDQSPTEGQGQTSPVSKIPVLMKKTPLRSCQHLIMPSSSHHHDNRHHHDDHCEVSTVIRLSAWCEFRW